MEYMHVATDAPHGVENPAPSVEALIYPIVKRGFPAPTFGNDI